MAKMDIQRTTPTFIKLLISVMFFISAFFLSAQTITIGNGTLLHKRLPIEPAARYSYTQQLFLASEISHYGTITHIGFQYNVAYHGFLVANRDWKIYLGESNEEMLESWIPISELNLVFDSVLEIEMFSGGLPGTGWLSIPLQEPFIYSGTQNLILAVDENSSQFGSSDDDFYCRETVSVRALNYQSLTINPDPENPGDTIYQLTALANLRLCFSNDAGYDSPSNLYGYYSGNALHLNWDPPLNPAVESYRVYRNGLLLATNTQCEYTDNLVEPGGTYSYFVKAMYPGGLISPESNSFFIEIPTSGAQTIIDERFDTLESFSTQIPGFINLDLDGSDTWDMDFADFPNETDSKAWMVFSPCECTPPQTQIQAHSPAKMLASQCSVIAPNNDWLILPNLNPGSDSRLSFWAKSHTGAYGLERLRVLVSTTGSEPYQFTKIHSEDFLVVPAEWTYYEFSLDIYAQEDIYLALNCISVNAAMLYVDDINVSGTGTGVENMDTLAPAFALYPNPSRSGFTLKSELPFDLTLYNIRGQRVLSQTGIKEYRYSGKKLSAGVYFLRIQQDGISTILRQVILP